MSRDKIGNIARRYRSGLISYGWALHLIAREGGYADAWTPIVVLSEAIQRVTRG